jgi:uncharacterized protein
MADEPAYDQAIAYALDCLQAQLSPRLTYHNLWHTQGDVLPAATRLARLSGIAEAEIRLLQVAAAYHDIGMIERHDCHELIGMRIVAQTLPEYGFVTRQIERIMGMILATRLPQSPRQPLEALLADADLDVLGRADFFRLNGQLWQEMAAFGEATTRRQWIEAQLVFMKQHTYCTAVAKTLREASKQKHILMLEKQLELL